MEDEAEVTFSIAEVKFYLKAKRAIPHLDPDWQMKNSSLDVAIYDLRLPKKGLKDITEAHARHETVV
jgi:hypothetical protein